MRPAFSIILFSTLTGLAQGLVVVLAIGVLVGAAPSSALLTLSLAVAEVLLGLGLAASFLHLGNKLMAWRAVMMWRTSWMSREVIALPAFMLLVGCWWWASMGPAAPRLDAGFAALAIVLALVLWVCTAMIYACLRFVQEWAHPLTVVNYVLMGLCSGAVLAGLLASLSGEAAFARAVFPWALASTAAAGAGRCLSLARNRRLRPRSTIQSATGIRHPRVVQQAMGMTGGSFNTREFFHHATVAAIRRARIAFVAFAFVLPLLLLAATGASNPLGWVLAGALQYAGLLLERWFFFAEARHPQNLYYQVVS